MWLLNTCVNAFLYIRHDISDRTADTSLSCTVSNNIKYPLVEAVSGTCAEFAFYRLRFISVRKEINLCSSSINSAFCQSLLRAAA